MIEKWYGKQLFVRDIPLDLILLCAIFGVFFIGVVWMMAKGRKR